MAKPLSESFLEISKQETMFLDLENWCYMQSISGGPTFLGAVKLELLWEKTPEKTFKFYQLQGLLKPYEMGIKAYSKVNKYLNPLA